MYSFYYVCYYFMLFFIMSIAGYIAECSFVSLGNKKVTLNRGFLMGPYIPIYGVGACSMVIFFKKYLSDPIVFFFMTSVICSFIEYITSYVMEKLFGVRWWDYTDERFNVNGRICLKNSFLFGLAGLVFMYTLYPVINLFLFGIPYKALIIMAIICFIIFASDFIFTVKALINVKSSLKNIKGDATEEIHEKISENLKKHQFQFNRLIKSHPGIERFNGEAFNEFRNRMIEIRNNMKQNKISK